MSASSNVSCIGGDSSCPCNDGDACHYRDAGNTKAWPIPKASLTLEQKWDNLWPLACAVTAAIEQFDRNQEPRDGATLMHMCRQLKKAVDYISPEPTNV